MPIVSTIFFLQDFIAKPFASCIQAHVYSSALAKSSQQMIDPFFSHHAHLSYETCHDEEYMVSSFHDSF
jgi:hypothetical protein